MSDTQTVHGTPTAKKPPRSRRGRRLLGLILVALVLLLAGVSFFLVKLVLPTGKIASTVAETGGLEWVRSIYGWGRDKSQQLTAPGSTAVGPDGTIWTANPGNQRVVGFNPDGSFKVMLAGSSKTPFVSPTDVGTDPAGNLYVGENTLSRVIVMTPQGQELRVIKVQTPTAVTASADRIVIGSVGGFAIFDKEGNALNVIGQQGKGDGQFDVVNGIAIANDGRIFIVDTYNNRLSAYDKTGKLLWLVKTGNPGNQSDIKKATTPKPSGTQANMQLPMQATIDASGRLVVADMFDFTLDVFNPSNGSLIKKYGAFGNEDGKMLYPSGIAYDKTRDWFAVADSGNNRLELFRIPDSAPGNTTAAVSRVLTGPIRACVFPLLLLLLAIIVGLVVRWRKNRSAMKETGTAAEQVQMP
jgi:hypothetical protein